MILVLNVYKNKLTNYFVKEHNTYSRPQDINVKRKSQSQQPIQNQLTSKLSHTQKCTTNLTI